MNDDVVAFRASTQGLGDADQLQAFREHFGRTILKVDMVPVGGHALKCDMTIRAMPDLALAHGTLSPVTSRHEEAPCDDVVLVALHEGHAELRQGHRRAAVEAGEAILTTHDDTANFTGNTPTRLTNVRFKRAGLLARGADPETMVGRTLEKDHFVLRLLLGYAQVLGDRTVAMDAVARHIVADSIYDLAALILPGSRPSMRNARAARLIAIKSDIRNNLSVPGLSISDVARRHGISGSYARRLFAEGGASFSDYVLEQRLLLAQRLLADPRLADRTVGTIAYGVGFSDLSYFNRTFRRRFGMTPTDVRAASR